MGKQIARTAKNPETYAIIEPQIRLLLELKEKTKDAKAANEIENFINERVKELSSESWCYGELAKVKWPKGTVCTYCNSKKNTFIKSRYIYQCNECRKQFSLTTNTILHRSRITSAQLYYLIGVVAKTGAYVKAARTGRDSWNAQPINIPDREMLKFKLRDIMTFLGTKSKGTGMKVYRMLAVERLKLPEKITSDQFIKLVLSTR